MNAAHTIVQTLNQTTINMSRLEDFLLGIPRYREAGFELGVSPKAGRLLHRTDVFEFELRQYLAGESKTRYHLNRSARTFLALSEEPARTLMRFSLNAVEATLLENEWYELMPSLRSVRKHLHKTFAI